MVDKKTEFISIDNIAVNNENARHGKLQTEKDAIYWLLSNNSSRLEALAKDIAKEGKLYERPLVKKENDKYVVHDGNRRITCLKLLNNPEYVKDTQWYDFFKTLKKNNSNIPDKVECDIADDIQYINELVERRHVGGDTGKGQLKWNREQKENHLILTGRKKVLDFTVYLQEEMRKEGLLSDFDNLEHSLIKRLFSNNKLRARIGFVLNDDVVSFIEDRERVLKILLKIHNDMSEGKETLKTLWNNADKERYLGQLEKDGLLVGIEDKDISKNDNGKSTDVSKDKKRVNKISFSSIIDIDFPIKAKTNEEVKIKAIWDEMQYRLKYNMHPYSLSVMIRVLLELSTDYCLLKIKTKKTKNDSLNTKMMEIIKKFEEENILNKTDANNLKGTATVDINRLHAFVHHLNAHPTTQDLIALWGKFKNYIINCLVYKK
ncbi:MAG: hypothetical protein E7004_06530 [Alphaproteobacteria bacterium]|nr:hypothetical protein [Alphaproteobacteria bacterium]